MESSTRTSPRAARRLWLLPLLAVLFGLAGMTTHAAAPTISPVLNQTNVEDVIVVVNFQVQDSDTPLNNLGLEVRSSNTGLLPLNRITFGGVDANRTITLAPANNQTGQTTVTILVNDGTGTNSTSFLYVVQEANDPPTFTTPLGPLAGSEDTVLTDTFGIDDSEDPNSQLTVTGSAVNSALVQSVSVTGTGGTRTVSVTPVPNANGTTAVTLVLRDTQGGSNTLSFNVTFTPVPDRPTVTPGTLVGTQANPIPDNASSNLFVNFTVSDVDDGRPNAESLSVAVSVITEGFGALNSESPVFTGSPSSVTTQLRALGFTPSPNAVSIGATQSFQVAIVVTDSANLRTTNLTTFYMAGLNDAPSVVATIVNPSIGENTEVSPFRVNINDADQGDNDLNFTVLLQPITDPGFVNGELIPAAPSFTGSRSAVANFIANVRYRSSQSVAGQTNVFFRTTVTDAHGASVSVTNGLTLIGINDPPEITGLSTILLRMTDDTNVAPIRPFQNVRVVDLDQGGLQNLTVTLTVNNPALGYFSSNTLSGIGADVSALLNAVTFTAVPRSDRVLNETITAILTITVSDGQASRNDSSTQVAITSVNAAPFIAVPLNQPLLLAPTNIVNPFRLVSIRDDSTNALTLTVSLDDPAKGVLTNLGAFTLVSPGVYRIFTNAAAASLAVSNLGYAVSQSYPFPVNAPGGTRFTLQAVDAQFNATIRTLDILVQFEPRNHLVTSIEDDGSDGTLRKAIALAGNNDTITFALAGYPQIIRLKQSSGPLVLNRNITLRGPGADLLTVSGDSDGNQQPDTQVFQIQSRVIIEGLTVADGNGFDKGVQKTGGAILVGPTGQLALRAVAVLNSRSTQWGGAIDVDRGALSLEGCLVRNNSTDVAQGLGGGGISLYTDQACSFLNTTFSGNRQRSASGIGGGALYVENFTPITSLEIRVAHCTFKDNEDAAALGSSIQANVFGTTVTVQNSIFADGQQHNLEVVGAGEVLSLGGNLSDDSTHTTLTQGGVPQEVVLLNAPSDAVDTNPGLLAFDAAVRPVGAYLPASGSPALNRATNLVTAIDQRGALRNVGTADAGAIEFGAGQRLVLHEIHFNTGSPAATDFVELFVPRDSLPLNLTGYSLWVNGTNRHLFTGNPLIQPGFGLVVADTALSAGLTRVDVPSGGAPLGLSERGLIEVRPPNSTNPVLAVNYNGVFADPFNSAGLLVMSNNSIALAPQGVGAAYVPSVFAQERGVSLAHLGFPNSPGTNSVPQPFGSPNAFPLGVNDSFVVGEDLLATLPVLANDSDSDGLDRLVLIGVGVTNNPAPTNATALTQLGATVTVNDSAQPLRGSLLQYNPRTSVALQQLAAGVERVDQFVYSMVDIGAGSILDFSATNSVLNLHSPAHRLTNGEVVVISGSAFAGYNGEFAVTRIDDDHFTIPVAFTADPSVKGSWLTKLPRRPTQVVAPTVTLTVIGANDAPVANPDVVNTDEETLIRILGDTNLLGTRTLFSTNSYPAQPVITNVALLANDDDIDTDDDFRTLKVVGVLPRVNPILGYSGTEGVSPVVVQSPGHGLVSGAVVLISGYGGYSGYNGFHAVTVLDSNSFSIPAIYVDDLAPKGVWAVLNDANRLSAVSQLGAQVNLEIRADRAETSVVYNPRTSALLNSLGVFPNGTQQVTNDTFYYAVQDSHGAVSIGQVTVRVHGLDDAPVPVADPGSLTGLAGAQGTQSLRQVVQQLSVNYFLPPASGLGGRADVAATLNGTSYTLADLWRTDENTALSIPMAALLGNDGDVDLIDVLTVAAVGNSHLGATVMTVGAPGLIHYDPSTSAVLNALAREESVIDTFPVTITDPRGSNVLTFAAVLVVGVNDSPVAFDDASTTPEDVALSFNPLLFPTNQPGRHDFDVDINGAAPDNRLSVMPLTNHLTPGGAVVNIANNQVNYDPTGSALLNGLAQGQTFVDTFTYRVQDHSLLFANDDNFKVAADGTGYVLDLLANDANFNGTGAFQIVAVGATGQGGTVSISGGGTQVTYTPEINFVGDEHFTYTIADASGNIDSALVTVRVTVNQLNGNLQANADRFTVAKGQAPLLEVLANDNILPAAGSALTITRLVSTPAVDQVTITNGRIRYAQTHAGPFPYTNSFSYEVSGGGTARAVALVTVQVVNREGTLNVREDSFTVEAGATEVPLAVLANDSILPGNGGLLSIAQILDAPTHGTAAIEVGSGLILYTPAAGFIGQDQFRYLAADGLGGTGTGVVQVNVGRLTTAPDFFAVAFDDALGTNHTLLTGLDVLANDTMVGGPSHTLTITAVTPVGSAGTLGTLTINGGTNLLFDPAVGVTGEGEFVYTVSDSSIPPNTAQGQLRLVVLREGVSGNPDYFSVLRDSSANELNVVLNDASIPARGFPLIVVSVGGGVSGPDHGGTVEISESGDRLIYTPAAGFSGEETFSYTVTDSRHTDTAQVVVRVTAGDLLANNDAFTVYFEAVATNEPLRSFTLPVLANDRVLPNLGQQLSIVGLGIDDLNATNAPGRQGEVVIAPDGASLIYTPKDTDGPFPYVERFTYEISDGTARRAEGVIVVEVQERSHARDVDTEDDAYTVAAGSVNNILSVLANDSVKPDSAATWIITALGAPNHGLAVISSGTILYTPASGFVGTDEFTYSVSDRFGGTGQATVRVKVGDVTVGADSFVVLSGTSANLLPVLLNDYLAPTDGKSYQLGTLATPDQGGAVALNSNRTAVLYTPDASFLANNPGRSYPYTERFDYTVLDDSGRPFTGQVAVQVFEAGSDRDEATVTITVAGVNDAPVVLGAGQTAGITDKQTVAPFAAVTVAEVDEQGQQLVSATILLDNAAKGVLTNLGGFVPSSPGRYSWQSTAAGLTAALRQMVFVPTENRISVPTTENAVFSLILDDGFVASPVTNSATVIPVTAVNDAPTIAGTGPVRVYSRNTVKPFFGVVISEVDDLQLQPEVVTVTLSDATHGYFTALGGFVSNSPTTLTLSGVSAASASAALQGLVFVPTPGNRVSPGVSESTTLTLSVNDGFAAPVVDANTVITVLDSPVARIQAGDRNGVNQSQFGKAVATGRDYAIIGAHLDNANNNSGSAYIFARSRDGSEQWTQSAKLLPFDGANNDQFGFAVAISGDFAAVGAPNDDDRGANSGSIYLFQRGASNAWSFVQKIVPTDGVAGAGFGRALALDGSTLVVGAESDSARGANAGGAYIYERPSGTNQWALVKKLYSSDLRSGDLFGAAVAVHRDTIVVGAPQHDETGAANVGAAYIFSRHQGAANAWGETKILLSSGLLGDEFGTAVAVSADTVVVGAPKRDVGAQADVGAAYVFERHEGGVNAWGFVKRLVGSDAVANDNFGFTVGVDGDDVAVASPFNDGVGGDAGAAYHFRRHLGGGNQWGQDRKFVPRAGVGSVYGYGLALRHSTLVVGAPLDATENGVSKFGAAYLYLLQYENGPKAIGSIPAQTAQIGQAFELILASGLFSDADLPDTLILSAGLSSGAALPAWLSFDANTGRFSGTPGSGDAGTWTVRVTATDLDGETASIDFSLQVAGSALASWRTANFGGFANNPGLESSLWGDLADPDGDGLNNRQEYLFGSNPMGASSRSVLAQARGAGNEITLTFVRRADDPGLTYLMEASPDMVTWGAAGALVDSQQETPAGPGLTRVSLQLKSPSPGAGPQFFRVRVSTTP